MAANSTGSTKALWLSLRTLAVQKEERKLIEGDSVRVQLLRGGRAQTDAGGADGARSRTCAALSRTFLPRAAALILPGPRPGTEWRGVPWEGATQGTVSLGYDDRAYALPPDDEELCFALLLREASGGSRAPRPGHGRLRLACLFPSARAAALTAAVKTRWPSRPSQTCGGLAAGSSRSRNSAGTR